MEAELAARSFVNSRFPQCDVAFLGGSTVRGNATTLSDLDIIVVGEELGGPYRESVRAYGWPVEVFVHTSASLRSFFSADARRRRPSLPRMCCEGIVLYNRNDSAAEIQSRARALLEKGPAPLPKEELAQMRYFLTNMIDDFICSKDPTVDFLLAAQLLEGASNLVLAGNRQWQADGKWIPWTLRSVRPETANDLAEAINRFQSSTDKAHIVTYVEKALEPVGGRLWEGFSQGKT